MLLQKNILVTGGIILTASASIKYFKLKPLDSTRNEIYLIVLVTSDFQGSKVCKGSFAE